MDNARYQRYTKDAALIRIANLPAAGAPAVGSGFLDLGNAEIGPLARTFDVEISVAPTPALADGKKLTLTLQDSADNVTYAPVASIAPLVVTGAGGTGATAAPSQFAVGTSIRRYLQVFASVDAVGGDNTAATFGLALVF